MPDDAYVDVGVRLHIRDWRKHASAEQTPFLLVHGLASNAKTWDLLARHLAADGHPVVAVDQRGHGLSEKPATGYDFDTITDDLHRLLDHLGWEQPIVAGQSWGGNVVVSFGARFPGRAGGLIMVDGGFLDLRLRPEETWEDIETRLRPPQLAGLPLTQMETWLRNANPEWSDEGIAVTLANFEHLPDGTIRPWLSLDRHMTIACAMWDQHPRTLYPQLDEPVLMAVAATGGDWEREKRTMVAQAERLIPTLQVAWFDNTAHDIHVHRPGQLARLFTSWLGAAAPERY